MIADPARPEVVERSRRTLPTLSIPLAAVASLAARLLHAPMAAVTLVCGEEEFFAAQHGLAEGLSAERWMPLGHSLCRYVVDADDVVRNADLRGAADPVLRSRLLDAEYDIRSVLGVPVRDDQNRPVGSLAVFDTIPRDWTGPEAATLLEIENLLRRTGESVGLPVAVTGRGDASSRESTQGAFLAVNSEGVVVGFNGAAEGLFGFTRDEVCNQRLDGRFFDRRGQRSFVAELDQMFAAVPARPVSRPVVLKHRDGRRLPMQALITVFSGAGGSVACLSIAPLSEQKVAEEQADRNAGFLAALLDSLSVGVLACDASGEIVFLNPAFREIHGLTGTVDVPADLPALTAGLLYDSDRQPLPWDRTPLMLARSGEYVHSDVIAIAPGQPVRTFAVTAQPIAAADGTSLGAVAVSHEVTALRRAEYFRACHLAVEHILTRTASIADAAPAILRAVVSALGWTAAELFLIDDSTGELKAIAHWGMPGPDPDQFFEHTPIKGAAVTGRVWQTGRQVWIRDIVSAKDMTTPFERLRADICIRNGVRTVLAVPVRDGGTLLGVLTCYAAATESHEDLLTVLLDGVAAQIATFIALRHAKELALQLNKSQNDFISLVGHELRTPLTSISAYASLLVDGGEGLDEDSRDMLHGIARNSDELTKIIARLLELAGLEAGHLPLDILRVDIAALITEAVAAVRAHATERRITIEVDTPALEIDGDAYRLRQAIDDLLSNALKYSPDGSDICVDADRDHNTVRIQITDTGIGVAVDERSRVFDRFFRGGNVRHHGTPGNGLGLSRARTIIELHGGTIGLLDNEPCGTIATIRLPSSRKPAALRNGADRRKDADRRQK